jgi:type VII secretion protein EccB
VLGIAGAPDSLPDKGSLLTDPWSICSSTVDSRSTVYIGRTGAGGRIDGGILASSGGGEYLLWHDHRYRLGSLARGALGWSSAPVTAVATALVNSLPAGPDLVAPAVPGRGRASRLAGARVGQVYVTTIQGGTRQYAVAVDTGLAAITELQADLLLGDPGTVAVQGQADARPLAPGQFDAALTGQLGPAGTVAVPATPPALVRPGGALCASSAGGLTVDASPDRAAVAVSDAGDPPGTRADQVAVAAGHGAVVSAVPAPGANGGALSLVTDLGIRYPLPGVDVLTALGYAGVSPVPVPATFVALLPAGPALDPATARLPH